MENNYNLITLGFIILGVILTVIPLTGKGLNHIVTLIHELGHALSSIILRGEIKSIRIEPDGSGSTISGHALTVGYKFNRILVLLSGYSFPLFLGVALLAIAFINPIINFWILGILALMSLLFIRNLFGLFIVLIFVASTLTLFIPELPLPFVPAFLGSLIFVGGWKDLILISKAVWIKKAQDSDFNLLEGETGVNAKFWVVFFYIYNGLITAGLVVLINYLISFTVVSTQ